MIDRALAEGTFPPGFRFRVIGDISAGTAGHPTRESAQASLRALKEAAHLLQTTDAVGVVTGPVSKEALQCLGFPYPGQTEFFAEVWGKTEVGMLLTGPTLTVGLATIHIPLAAVPAELNSEGIVTIGRLTTEFLIKRGRLSPKIAVCGLNPHAGENGTFGTEEKTIIGPAIAELNRPGIACFSGPHVPDAIYRDAALGNYDAVLAMYHDQGLIPLKLLDFDEAVNVTLGLPKVRTSPDHGTAFNIAGKNLASPSSMIAAIQLACELSK